MSPDISVVVTTFNQSFDSIKASLLSIVLQKHISFEIIIADDHSDVDLSNEFISFFAEHDFVDYQLIRNPSNLKTVLNIANALNYVSAPYVKAVDAGDMLYSSETLKMISDCCRRERLCAGFGHMVRFSKTATGSYATSNFHAPRDVIGFANFNDQNRPSLLKHQLEASDWIPAPAQFYEAAYYQDLLYKLNRDYGVFYCQDFTMTLALIDGPLYYLDKPIYWYEWGVGISTSGSISSRQRLYKDHDSFYGALCDESPLCLNLSKARRLFLVKKWFALHTPLYRALLRRLNRRISSQHDIPLNDFFTLCIDTKCQ